MTDLVEAAVPMTNFRIPPSVANRMNARREAACMHAIGYPAHAKIKNAHTVGVQIPFLSLITEELGTPPELESTNKVF